MNRLILIKTLDKAKEESSVIQSKVEQAHTDAGRLRQDLEAGSTENAAKDIAALGQDFKEINLALASSLAGFEGIQSMADEESTESPTEHLLRAEQIMLQLEKFNPDQQDFGPEVEQTAELEQELQQVDDFLGQFGDIDSAILARPFAGEAIQRSNVSFGPIDFYVPGVISLLLQHIALTLAALAIVREKVGGSVELFRAAPVSAFETLLGKTTSFIILGGILAAILTLLVIFGQKIPMLGSWLAYTAVVLALLYTSLAMGFAISTISQTDSQAVQYSMIVLLASIFFSGFFIALQHLLTGVHIVSWLLPATYGTAMLQDIMLRGRPLDPVLLLGLTGYGILLFGFAWWRLRRLMSRE